MRAIVVLGGLASLVTIVAAVAEGSPWLLGAAVLVALLAAWGLSRLSSPAAGPPTFAIWGRWRGPRWLRLRDGLWRALTQAGYAPARGRDAPDILICGPGAPRLAGWTPRRVATYVLGVVPRRAGGDQPERWAVGLLRHLAWDAVAYTDLDDVRPTATVVDQQGDATAITGRSGPEAFARALARLLIAHTPGGNAGAAGF